MEKNGCSRRVLMGLTAVEMMLDDECETELELSDLDLDEYDF